LDINKLKGALKKMNTIKEEQKVVPL